MELLGEELLGKRPRFEVGEGPLGLGEAFRVCGDGEEGVDGRFALLAVSLVDLVLPVCSTALAVAVVPGSGLGVEWAVVALFAEEEEVRDLLVFLSGEGRGAGNVVCLEVGELVSFEKTARPAREKNSRETALLACRQWQCWDRCSRGRCLARCFWTLRHHRRPVHLDRPGLRGRHLFQTFCAMGEVMRDVPRFSELVLALFGLAGFGRVSCHSDAVDDSFFGGAGKSNWRHLLLGSGPCPCSGLSSRPLSSPTQRWSNPWSFPARHPADHPFHPNVVPLTPLPSPSKHLATIPKSDLQLSPTRSNHKISTRRIYHTHKNHGRHPSNRARRARQAPR